MEERIPDYFSSWEEYEEYQDKIVTFFEVSDWRELEDIMDFLYLIMDINQNGSKLNHTFEQLYSTQLKDGSWEINNNFNENKIIIETDSELQKFEECAFGTAADLFF